MASTELKETMQDDSRTYHQVDCGVECAGDELLNHHQHRLSSLVVRHHAAISSRVQDAVAAGNEHAEAVESRTARDLIGKLAGRWEGERVSDVQNVRIDLCTHTSKL